MKHLSDSISAANTFQDPAAQLNPLVSYILISVETTESIMAQYGSIIMNRQSEKNAMEPHSSVSNAAQIAEKYAQSM